MAFNKSIRGLFLVVSFMFQACLPMEYDDDMKYLTRGMRELYTVTSDIIRSVIGKEYQANELVPTLTDLASAASLQDMVFYFIQRNQKVPRIIMDSFFRYRQKKIKEYGAKFSVLLKSKFENCTDEQEFVRFILKQMLNGCSYQSMGWDGESLTQYAREKSYWLLHRTLLNCGAFDTKMPHIIIPYNYRVSMQNFLIKELKTYLSQSAWQDIQPNFQIVFRSANSKPVPFLSYIVERGGLEAVKFVVNSGASIYICSDDGQTPYLTAIAEGKLDILKYFLELDPTLINQTVNEKSAFCAMTYRTTDEVIAELIACNVYPTNIDGKGTNASDKAQSIVRWSRCPRMTQDIIEKLKQYENEYLDQSNNSVK